MSIERSYYCDGPENSDLPGDGEQPNGCPHHVRAKMIDNEYIPGGFLQVRTYVQGATYETLHFCSWDCLLRYAATVKPVEYFSEWPDTEGAQ